MHAGRPTPRRPESAGARTRRGDSAAPDPALRRRSNALAYLSEDAYKTAAEPKELLIIRDASHVDLYDRLDEIPFDRIAAFLAVSGLFALMTSLGIASATRGIDRRRVLLALTLLMLASGVIVTLAPSVGVFMAGRALVGAAIGGFWSMSAATVMRLVPSADVPRALGVLNGGNALAATIAAPLGSFLGQFIGWRGAFFAVVPLAALTFGWLCVSLPPMPSARANGGCAVFRVLRRVHVTVGMLAVALFFPGQFTLFTYVRPNLETVTRVDGSGLSLMLLITGVAGLAGTWLIGPLPRTGLVRLLIAMPLAMAAVALALVLFGHSTIVVGALLAWWGLIGTATGGMVDVVEPSGAGRRGGWWRTDGCGDPACDCRRRDRWWRAVRRDRVPQHLRGQRCGAARLGAGRGALGADGPAKWLDSSRTQPSGGCHGHGGSGVRRSGSPLRVTVRASASSRDALHAS